MEHVYKDKQQPTKEERAAKKDKARWDAEENMAARKKGEEAFKSNYARLKADEVRMPTRIANALSNAGLRTLGEVRVSSDANLLTFQDVGPGTVRWLRESL